jgi:hypothetical protein
MNTSLEQSERKNLGNDQKEVKFYKSTYPSVVVKQNYTRVIHFHYTKLHTAHFRLALTYNT